MEEYLDELIQYLPLEFEDCENQNFIRYLKESCLENFQNNKFQFSFISFHLLYMVFIYKTTWLLSNQRNPDIGNFLQEYSRTNHGVNFYNFFDYSQISEKTNLEELLKSLHFHMNEIKICKNHIDVRNNCAHASGKIYYKKVEQIGNYINEELNSAKQLHDRLEEYLKSLLVDFIENKWQSNNLYVEEVSIFIKVNYLSGKDIGKLINISLPILSKLSDKQNVVYKKILYLVFIYHSQKILSLEKNIFLDNLPALMVGLPEEINIDKDGEKLIKKSRMIIEEEISPLLDSFSLDDLKKAQSILDMN